MWYVYILLDPRKPGKWYYNNILLEYQPFYVGKGTRYRVIQHFTKGDLDKMENPWKCNTIKNIITETEDKPKYVKIYTNIQTSKEAGDLETQCISYFKTNYPNILTNILPGGDQPPIMVGKDNPKSKKVYQFSLDGNYLNCYETVSEAEKKCKVNHAHISDCCNCKRRSAGGFLWAYDLKGLNNTSNKVYFHKNYKNIIAFTESETLFFSDQKEALKYFKQKNKGQIKRCIENPSRSFMGYYWKLKED